MISLLAARGIGRIDRRQALRLSALGTAGLALSPAALAASSGRARAKHCIFIFLCGGPSQLDLWDPKPDAPEGIRGPFAPIATRVPGVRLTELLPRVARHADKFAIVRSMTHSSGGHEDGIVHTLLGQKFPRPREFYASRHDHPGLGAILHKLRGGCGDMPAWAVLPRPFTTSSPPYKGQSAGFLGAAYDPVVLDEPKVDSLAAKDLRVKALDPPGGVDASRLAGRRRLLASGNAAPAAKIGPPGVRLDGCYDRAFALLSADPCRRAFDLTREPDRLRDLYGRNEYGQSFLLARRLVEAGVRVVNVFWTFFDARGCQFNLWDNHGVDSPTCGTGGARTGLEMIRHDYCCPSFDRAFSALLEDLGQRGLLQETLVAVTGEFGRTPRMNATAGRDHWPHCYSQLLAGGGVRGGRTYGSSDRHAGYVKDLPVTPDDFSATVLHAFGVPPDAMVRDQLGRPQRASEGRPLTALFG